MYFALMGKLNARRKQIVKTDDDKGFTLIELLVVVIIIGILAAIAIPVYLGVQNNAKNSGVQSDVTNLKTAIVSLQTSNAGTLPTTYVTNLDGTAAGAAFPTAVDYKGAGATIGTNTKSLSWGLDKTDAGVTWCIVGVSTTGTKYYATDNSGVSTTLCTIG